MNPKYWYLKTRADLFAAYDELCGKKCDGFRGAIACWPADDKARKPAGESVEFVSWGGVVTHAQLVQRPHLLLSANGVLQALTDKEFEGLQGVFAAMVQANQGGE